MTKTLVLHGPNLNLLGQREPTTYGTSSLNDLNKQLHQQAKRLNLTLNILQSNHEGVLIDAIHEAKINNVTSIIINPAAFTHTSIALRDALLAVEIPFIEVHLSNPHAREIFRQQSFFSDIATGVICGFGLNSYTLALEAVAKHFTR